VGAVTHVIPHVDAKRTLAIRLTSKPKGSQSVLATTWSGRA
jgi:hypothetical protein